MSVLDIIHVPGVLTDIEHPSYPDGSGGVDMHETVARGYEWISFQLVNGSTLTHIDIDKYGRASGFKSVGGWGVVYDQADFYAFGKRFAQALVAAGADHAIVDAEMCAKGTRTGQKMLPIITGMRDGGWAGPVHLCPLGAPANGLPHGGNDFGVDTKSFTDTGGGVLPQAYFNAYDEYRPDLCVDYWVACGVPRDRINVMIELAVEGAKMQKITGAQWVPLLKTAGVKEHGGFSVYMVQHATKEDWAGLDTLSKVPTQKTYWQVQTNAGLVLHEEAAITYPDKTTGLEKAIKWMLTDLPQIRTLGKVVLKRVQR